MTANIERRYLMREEFPDAISVEKRDGSPPVLVGISPPWDSLSVDLGGFREKFAPTAFDGLVDRSPNDPRGKIDVPFLTDHLSHLITGRTTNGRLTLSKELKGLGYRHTPLDTTHGLDLIKMVDDRTITGSSFAFTTAPQGDTWTEDDRGNLVRTVFKVDGLYDISAVTYPAYPASSVALGSRSIPLWREARALATREAGSGLLISLDYDRTYTAATGLWRSFVADATARGNRVVCISRREDTEQNREELRAAFDGVDVSQIVLCGAGQSKRAAAAAAGLEVDVWVDDYPEGIVSAGKRSAVPAVLGSRAAAAAAVARLRNTIGG